LGLFQRRSFEVELKLLKWKDQIYIEDIKKKSSIRFKSDAGDFRKKNKFIAPCGYYPRRAPVRVGVSVIHKGFIPEEGGLGMIIRRIHMDNPSASR